MSTTLRTGPLPRTGSTRSSPSSSTRAMSEPKIAVAPPAGAVMMVRVFALMASRFGSVHVSSGLGMPSGRAACGARRSTHHAHHDNGREKSREEPHGSVS
jgi:hypothetical protein